ATAMAISAMPVIAKILIDLNMLKRNFGLVILSAAVVDDTIGWIVLAMIAGLVTTGGVDAWHVITTLAWLLLFLTFAALVLFPILNWILRHAEHELRGGGELVLIVTVALLCAAATEAMHVHAVFGAFVAGVILRQCTGLSKENLHRLETVTLALFAPLFFGSVGLRVDLTQLSSLTLPLVVIVVAVAGKVIGCFLGGVLGKLPRWEALALGLGMSARGAMGLVVAKVGLELGILNQDLFSSLVLMALITSLLAPISLKAIAHKLPMSDEEKLRERGGAGGFVPSGNLKILVPAAGGQNAVMGCHIASQLCTSENDRVTALYVEGAGSSWLRRLTSRSQRLNNAETDSYFNRLKSATGQFASRLTLRKQPSKGTILETIIDEARAGYHFLVIGASGQKHPLYDPFVSSVVKQTPCHLVVVGDQREVEWQPQPFKHILVPTNGSYFSDAAFEFAARYADATDANITVVYIAESRKRNPLLPAAAVEEVADHVQDMMRITLKQQLAEKMKHPERLECHVRESESVVSGLAEEFQREKYDLVVLGAENKSLVERLYLGQHIEQALTELPCPIALVIPKVGAR
ncbi:MAG TPA: cation:proton antiporter, partial [Planctomycetota bacterium]|nr:cation:proton antiporter [Planctomycetota bacterium]